MFQSTPTSKKTSDWPQDHLDARSSSELRSLKRLQESPVRGDVFVLSHDWEDGRGWKGS